MPNGTCGGVRGRLNSPYSIYNATAYEIYVEKIIVEKHK